MLKIAWIFVTQNQGKPSTFAAWPHSVRKGYAFPHGSLSMEAAPLVNRGGEASIKAWPNGAVARPLRRAFIRRHHALPKGRATAPAAKPLSIASAFDGEEAPVAGNVGESVKSFVLELNT